jgi:succinate dehydrogenase / fumarate reductase cytochrome b subunit
MSSHSRERVSSSGGVWRSSVGTKIIIGVTGLFLALYLIIHIAGNAMVFLGPVAFNDYAHTLSSNPLIPVIEIVLLVAFLVHVYRTVRMYVANQQARPVGYAMKRRAGPPSRKTLASSTMIVSGLWLLIFIIVHVRTFRFDAQYRTAEGIVDLYRVEMEAFRSPLAVAFYVVSMVVVGSHLWHGAASGFQSLGIDHPRWTPRILAAGKAFAVVIAAGFIVITLWAHFVGGRP